MKKMRVAKLDREQMELGASDEFWKLVVKWRKQKGLSREALERIIKNGNNSARSFRHSHLDDLFSRSS